MRVADNTRPQCHLIRHLMPTTATIGQQIRPACQHRSQRPLPTRRRCFRPLRATSGTEAQPDILQVEVALQQRQLEMADCAAREDYSGAAVARDAARRLELQLRTMQLEQERIDRTTIKYKLGTIVVHKRYRYRGVICGFSQECEQSESWVRMMRVDSLPLGRKQPFFNVLVDVRDRPNISTTYVAQENILPAESPQPIQHPLVETYFSEFQDGRYEPKYTLRSQYPE